MKRLRYETKYLTSIFKLEVRPREIVETCMWNKVNVNYDAVQTLSGNQIGYLT